MDLIFHEKQEGSLCAQHCLNALLQGSYFTAVDLADIGRRMDNQERMHMAESGVASDEYNHFLQQPSSNVDDSGYFSVQVLSAALSVWGLELLPYSSSDLRAVAARTAPNEERAFICHYRDHWLTVRKLGSQWFNLNSLLRGPELLSGTYLALFLAQLQTDKYSIFVVVGDLPACEADRALLLNPARPPAGNTRPVAPATGQDYDDDDEQLKAVLELSKSELDDEDAEQTALNKAILLSLQGIAAPAPAISLSGTLVPDDGDDDLKKAIAMSLEGAPVAVSSAAVSPAETQKGVEDLEFIRQRRLLRLSQPSTFPS